MSEAHTLVILGLELPALKSIILRRQSYLRSLGQPWSSAARSLSRSSAALHLKAPAPACPAVVLASMVFSLMQKDQLLLLQGHIAAHGQKSQSTKSMSWERLKASSILGCCTASPVSAIDIVPWNLKSVSLENIQLSQVMAKLLSMAMLPIFRI